MLPYERHIELIRSPDFTLFGILFESRYITSYSFFLTLAVVSVVLIALLEARRLKLDRKTVLMIALSGFIGAYAGARLFFIAFWEKHDFIGFWQAVFDLSHAGLASSGTFIGGFLGVGLYALLSKKNILRHMDVFAVGAGLGIALGRLGCHFAGCCYGTAADLPWSVFYLEALRHPAQLYEVMNGLIIFGVILSLRKKRLPPGVLFAIFTGLYSFIRFFIEFVREEPRWYGITASQIVYACLFVLSLAFIYRRCNRYQRTISRRIKSGNTKPRRDKEEKRKK
jgi:phosphatidylglycerol---prolipoprotein diacylglyceryl transferase